MSLTRILVIAFAVSVFAGGAVRTPLLAGPKTETWTQVTSPHFMVVTNASAKDGRRVATQFEQARNVFLTLFRNSRADAGEPIRVLATKDEAAFKVLLPQYYEEKGHMHPQGVFQAGQERNYVVLRLDSTAESAFQILYHEYTHFLLQLNYGQLPIWVGEGLAEFFGHMRIGAKEVVFGQPIVPDVLLLQMTKWIPMNELFAARHDSPYYNEANKASIFYAQSWALTHYLMLGGTRSMSVTQYIRLLVNEHMDQVEAAHRAFGDPAALTKELQTYVSQGRFREGFISAPASLTEAEFPARELTQAESLAVRGDFLVYSQRPKEARPLLEEAVQLDPKLAAPHESLGVLELNGGGDQAGAAKEFALAVALDSRSALALFYTGMSSINTAGGVAHGGAPEVLKGAEAHLRKSLEINPEFAPAHSYLSYVLMLEGENSDEAVQHALRAVALEPGSSTYIFNAGRLLMSLQRYDEAQKLGQKALGQARGQADEAQAKSLIAEAQAQAEWQRMREQIPRQPAAASPTKAVEAARPGGDGDSQATRPALVRKQGEQVVFKGQVTEASCKGMELTLTLARDGQALRLGAPNYGKLEYETFKWEPPDSFTPCKHLLGRTVSASYLKLSGGSVDGELVKIQVLE